MRIVLSLLLVLPLLDVARAAPATRNESCCNILELRQYITYPGRRDELISLFEREFIESQEAAGIRVLGTFRDQNDPHRFTWIRGFTSMPSRKQSLSDFYFGPLWKSLAQQANATLYDNDDVLLLRPASPGSAFAAPGFTRAPREATAPQRGLVVATLYYLKQEAGADFIKRFNDDMAPIFTRSGARILGSFVTEKSANSFERLPVRENLDMFVWLAHFDDRAAYSRYQAALAADLRWRDTLFAPLYQALTRAPETLMLEPTARSLLR